MQRGVGHCACVALQDHAPLDLVARHALALCELRDVQQAHVLLVAQLDEGAVLGDLRHEALPLLAHHELARLEERQARAACASAEAAAGGSGGGGGGSGGDSSISSISSKSSASGAGLHS